MRGTLGDMSPDSRGDGQGHPPLRGVLLSPCPFFEGSKNVTGENRGPALPDAPLGGTSGGGNYRRSDPHTPSLRSCAHAECVV